MRPIKSGSIVAERACVLMGGIFCPGITFISRGTIFGPFQIDRANATLVVIIFTDRLCLG